MKKIIMILAAFVMGIFLLKAGVYDGRYPLLIDPLLSWSTFLGGSGYDEAFAVAVDTNGNVYVAGLSEASWGSPVNPYSANSDVFVAKMNRSGSLLWNTFLGSSGNDQGYGIAVDTSGNVYVAGLSSATWGSPINPFAAGDDAFVAKLNGNGGLQWNTFLGSASGDIVISIGMDSSGNIYAAGYSHATWGSPVNPFTAGWDVFVAKLNSGGALQWNTFLGGIGDDEGYGIAVDSSGNACLTGYSDATWGSPANPFTGGWEAFVAKLNGSGVLQWNTFLGGSDDDQGDAITVDTGGNVYVTGYSGATWGSPVHPYSGSGDIFIAKLNGSGVLQWNTFLGGSGYEDGCGIAVDSSHVYVTGNSSETWGSPKNPYSDDLDAFVAKLDHSGDLQWNTFLGQPGYDCSLGETAINISGNVYIAGMSEATWGSPVNPFSGDFDAFVAKIVEKDDLLGTWDGQGAYYRNSETGKWIKLASPADLIAAGDLGGDGIDDLITVFPGTAGVWTRSSSTGTWAKLSTTAAKHMSSGDMNGDGRVDLLATWDGVGVYYRNSISGAWTKIAQPANLLASADLDGDSKDDPIIIFPTPAGVWVKYSKTATWAKLSSTSAKDIASGDMNGDGRDDLLCTLDGSGIYYRNSISGAWVKMAMPADQVTAGDADGDGTDDLIASWTSPPGVYVKSSKTGTWTKLADPATDIATGVMRGGIWGSGAFGFIPQDGPLGGYAESPIFLSGYEDLSSQGPGGWRFAAQEEENLLPLETGEALAVPGPGDPGFRYVQQKNLFPQENSTKERGVKREGNKKPRKQAERESPKDGASFLP